MYDANNVFAKILREELPYKEIYSDDEVLAFQEIMPAAPVHILVVPKGEYTSFDDFVQMADRSTIEHFFKTIQTIAAEKKLDQTGYRLIMNHGAHASQTIPHFHVHILGGKPLGGLIPSDSSHR